MRRRLLSVAAEVCTVSTGTGRETESMRKRVGAMTVCVVLFGWIALALGGCSEGSSESSSSTPVSQEQAATEPSLSLDAPIIVKACVPLDCGSSQLLFEDKSGNSFCLYNKPFSHELFLSADSVSNQQDVHITKGHPLKEQLAAALTSFANSQADEKTLEKIRAQGDWTQLTKQEQVLAGTLSFAERLRGIQ